MNRREQIKRRIVAEVFRYYSQFAMPMAMQILSAKYAKALYDLGGFPEAILELEATGELRIEVRPSGARLVLPGIPKHNEVVNAAYYF